MNMDVEKVKAIQELLNLFIDVGTQCARIMAKNNITLEDVESLKTMIKEKPEDYFTDLKK